MKKLFILLIVLLSAVTLSAQQEYKSKFQLCKLPYPADALEPAISEEAMTLHHQTHLKNYVDKLNALVAGTNYEKSSLEVIVFNSSGDISDNAGQVLNHNLFFEQFSPEGGDTPDGELEFAITGTWGSLENFKKEFIEQGTTLFGSGWVWLSTNESGNLCITQEEDGANPLTYGLIPLLGIDVWEHAYYLDYQNKRAEYINALWDKIDWDVIEERFEER